VPVPMCALPKTLGRNPQTREWEPREIVARYRKLWSGVSDYLAAQDEAWKTADVDPSSGESIYFSFPIVDLVLEAIHANYRVGPDEAEILGIVDQTTFSPILDVLTDASTLDAWLKKKLGPDPSTGSVSEPGPEHSTTESTTATSQA
ncbi:MAG: hypothetical protein AAFX06_31400, partial [Planctomycetota bacterium]